MTLHDALKETGRAWRKAVVRLNFGSGQVEGLATYWANADGGHVDLEFKGKHFQTRLMRAEERTIYEDWTPYP